MINKYLKRAFYTALSISMILGLSSCNKTKTERTDEVIVYSYDSFLEEWGPGPELTKLFQEKTGKTLTFVSVGDGGKLVIKAKNEKKYPQADVICGIDGNMLKAAIETNNLLPYKTKNFDSIIPELNIDPTNCFTPFDYSFFSLIWDSLSDTPAPKSLSDLTKPEYKKKLILMSPKTSTPGLGFALWTAAIFGDNFEEYWKDLKPSILTMAPSWSTGYGLFTNGEAPLVCSYTTSPAYHVEYDSTDRYKALIFEEGHVMQIEGAAILKSAQNKEGAKLFIDFLTSEEAQTVIPLTQWMYPVNAKVQLPECYKASPKAEKILSVQDIPLERVQSLTF